MDKNAVSTSTAGIIPVIDVHRRLRIARDIYSTRISQDDFGTLVGISGNTVGNYETGATTRLKDIYIQRWAEVTGVDYWWLKTGLTPNDTDPNLPHSDYKSADSDPAALGAITDIDEWKRARAS